VKQIELTEDEKRALRLYRENNNVSGWQSGNVSLNTIRSLINKGLFSPSGITDLGKQYLGS